MNCGQQGRNKLMMTRIPNFREIIIVAFECESSESSFDSQALTAVSSRTKCRVERRFRRRECAISLPLLPKKCLFFPLSIHRI